MIGGKFESGVTVIASRLKFATALSAAILLAACGGGGGGGGGGSSSPPTTGGTPTPPPPTGSACSLGARQDWAEARIDEWYLFPETLPANPSSAGHATVQSFIDYLTATARAQGRDRFFTYITSIAEETAFYEQGANAGFGIRLSYDVEAGRVLISEAFEGAPALAAGLDRGTEILAIGTNSGNLRNVSDILAEDGAAGVVEALGPPDAGVSRAFRLRDAGGTFATTVTKAEYEILPVSPRYGALTLDDGGRKVGYLNLRTFIDPADPAMRQAFADFRAQGITDYVIDLRYNGGGLVSIAELLTNLLGRNRRSSEVLSRTIFRGSKSQFNETEFFDPQSQSVAPVRIAFIGTEGTASASELVINALIPYFGANLALIGTDTYGKPVGQIAQDREECDDRLRIVAFRTENADRQGDYYGGLAGTVAASCRAPDDVDFQLGDPDEPSVATALDFLAGRSCTPIPTTSTGPSAEPLRLPRILLRPRDPSAAQIEMPGSF
ncbi:MAG: S41 family peptidase [Parasphingopyxis sp.]